VTVHAFIALFLAALRCLYFVQCIRVPDSAALKFDGACDVALIWLYLCAMDEGRLRLWQDPTIMSAVVIFQVDHRCSRLNRLDWRMSSVHLLARASI